MRLRIDYRLSAGQRLRACVLRPGDPCASHVRPEAEVVWTEAAESDLMVGSRWLPGPT
jgi:hypothetical protein